MSRQYAVHLRVDNAYLVKQREWRILRDLLVVVAAIAVLGGGLWSYTWLHTERVRTGYKIRELEARLHEAEQRERRLRLEVAERVRPERVEERARQELGMRAPTLEQTVFFEEWVEPRALAQAAGGVAGTFDRVSSRASPAPPGPRGRRGP